MAINWKNSTIDLQKNNNNKNIWIKPITKGKFFGKLIPFFVITLIALGIILTMFIVPSFSTMTKSQKTGCYAIAPIFIIIFTPICWYFFDKAYCQYNLKHNEKIKNKIAKYFVKQQTDNCCFNLREIYLANPNQLAWKINQDEIILNFKKWDPKGFDDTIKYYREMTKVQ